MKGRLHRTISAAPQCSRVAEFFTGLAAGILAALIRLALPLQPEQLPTSMTVVAVALVTSFVGTIAGIVAALSGLTLTWIGLYGVDSSSSHPWFAIPAFIVVATVIVTTSALFRASVRKHEASLRAEAAMARLFAGEMSHRLKNALALVQSIVFQTIGFNNPASLILASRLRALADANELLTEHVSKPTATIRSVIETAMKPFPQAERLIVIGADGQLDGTQVVSLALVLHELATNATKHGAWSVQNGVVTIEVEDLGRDYGFTWQERGGPAVVPPSRTGFGSRLLARVGKEAHSTYSKDGLIYAVSFPKA